MRNKVTVDRWGDGWMGNRREGVVPSKIWQLKVGRTCPQVEIEILSSRFSFFIDSNVFLGFNFWCFEESNIRSVYRPSNLCAKQTDKHRGILGHGKVNETLSVDKKFHVVWYLGRTCLNLKVSSLPPWTSSFLLLHFGLISRLNPRGIK